MRRGLLLIALAWVALYTPLHAQNPAAFEPVRCVVAVSTATTITAVGGDCAAKTGRALFITDITFATTASGTAADAVPTIKYGTGTTCGTGTTIIWLAAGPAGGFVAIDNMIKPLQLPQAVDVCWINSTAGSKSLVIRGFYST
jgi:hypothetical protein